MASKMMTTGSPFEKFPVGGIDEPDNVAESEGEGNVDDSDEEEWNYIKGEQNGDDKNETNQQTPEKHHDQPTPVDADDENDMDSQLNPNAAEFVPVSPSRSAPNHLLDDVISASPMKGCEKSLDNIIVPTEEDFRRDVANCASSLEDDINGDLNTTAKDQFNDSQFTALSQCDDSEVMSTKAEFGDSVFGLGVSMNNSTAFVAEIHNDKENSEPVTSDFNPTEKDLNKFDAMQAPEHDDSLIPGTPKSTAAEAPLSPNFDGEDQPFEIEKPQEQPKSVSPVLEESRPPTFAEIVKRQSPRSSAENSPRTTPEPPESPPPVHNNSFNPFSSANDISAAPESLMINSMSEFEKKFETIQEESKQTFEDIILPGKTATHDFNHADTNPFSVDNVDFTNFGQNTVNNQMDMMSTKPSDAFNHELNTPDDEKPPMTFQVETEQTESSKNETNFEDFISQNTDPMTQSFIASPVLENPSHVEMSLMPEVPLDNDVSSFESEKISEHFEAEKPSFGFTDDKLENEFTSIVENRFEDKPLVDTTSNNELFMEENNFAAPLSPVGEEIQDQPPVTNLQMDETHFDTKLGAEEGKIPLTPEVVSPIEPQQNSFDVLETQKSLEPLETDMDHFSHPIPEVPARVMDDFLATESRDNLIEAVSNEIADEVCLMKADVSANVEDVSEVAAALEKDVVESLVPEEKQESAAVTLQKEESLEKELSVDFVEPKAETPKVEELVAAEVHPVTETPPPTPAPAAEPIEEKKEGLIAAAAAVAGAAVAVGAAATTKAATAKKPTTLSSAGAKKPGVTSAAAKKPTDLAAKTAGAKAAPAKAAPAAKAAAKPAAATAVKKTTATATTAAAKPSKPLAGLKSATTKPSSPASKPTTPTSKPSTPTSSSRPSSAPKTSPTKTTAIKSTVGSVAAAKPKPAVAADKKPLTNGVTTSRPASSTLAAKKPATTTAAKTAAKPAPATAAKPAATKVGAVAASKPKAPVSSTTGKPAAAPATAKPPPIRAPAKPSDKTGKETINKQISSAKTAVAKTTAAAPTKPAPIKKTDAKPSANGKVPAGKPVPKSSTAVKKVSAPDDKKKKAEVVPTQEHTVTTTNGYEQPPLIEANGLAKDDSPIENHIHPDALVIN